MPDKTKARLLEALRLAQAGRATADPQALIALLQAQRIDEYDLAPIPFLALSPQGVIRETNLAGASLLGKPCQEDLIGEPFIEAARVSESPPFWRHLRACMEGPGRVTDELTIRPDGGPRQIKITSTPLWEDGQITGVRSVLVDVTEMKRAQAHAAVLGNVGKLLVSSLPKSAPLSQVASTLVPDLADGCIVELADPGSTDSPAVAFADPAKEPTARRLCGSLPFSRRMRATERAELHEGIDPVVLGALALGPEDARLYRELGIDSLVIAPVASRGRVLGALALVGTASGHRLDRADLELAAELGVRMGLCLEHVRLHEELDGALSTRDEVLRLVTHDLGNNLTAIHLQASALRAQPDKPSHTAAQARIIEVSASMSRRLVQDLLDLSDMERGKLSLRSGKEDISALVAEAMESLEPVARSQQVALATVTAADPLPAACDRDRILQVLTNVIGNAIKFTPLGGRVTVAVRPTGPYALLSVSDTGPGIPSEQRDQVFQKFWRGGDKAGSGLGLFISRRIVEAHGGRIWLDAARPGATFCFTLPAGPLDG